MKFAGGCYCGALRYEFDGEPAFKGQCHCRECQYISGGGANVIIGLPATGFHYTKGAPKGFSRTDIANPVTREFCAACGTHILAKSPGLGPVVVLKVGTMDDPSAYGAPQMAIFLKDKQTFHHVPEGVASFQTVPSRG